MTYFLVPFSSDTGEASSYRQTDGVKDVSRSPQGLKTTTKDQ